MKFEFIVLGSNSAIPSPDRFPSAHILSLENQNYLIDCGEGTQMKISQFRIKASKIHQIFISHLHGDHVFGLPGLLTSYHMQGRREMLSVYGPQGLEELIVHILELTGAQLSYELVFHEFYPHKYQKIFEDSWIRVFSIPLKHRLPTSGYLFREKFNLLNIRKEAITTYNLSIDQIKKAKEGEDIILKDGKQIPNQEITLPLSKPRSIAYCSDTAYDESIIPYITGVDLLYHEATYLHNMAGKARARMHSTAREAATIARKANVEQLVIGHYSSRYKDLDPLLEEAREVFEKTELASEGRRFEVKGGESS